MKQRICHKCAAAIDPVRRIGRRDACDICGWDLHACMNCAFYDEHYHNQCTEPQAERQVDKTAGNFCEYFSFRLREAAPATPKTGDNARARLEAMFAKNKK